MCPTTHATRMAAIPSVYLLESGERVLADRDCGPPSLLPEGTAIPSTGTIRSGLSSRLCGRAQPRDMSSFTLAEFFSRAVHRYEALPILYMPVLHTGQVPRVAARPFFIVICSAF